MAGPHEQFVFAGNIGLNHLWIIEGKRQSIEHFRRAELGVSLQDRLDPSAIAKEREDASHGYARAGYVGATAEDGRFDSDMWMGDKDDRKRQGVTSLPPHLVVVLENYNFLAIFSEEVLLDSGRHLRGVVAKFLLNSLPRSRNPEVIAPNDEAFESDDALPARRRANLEHRTTHALR